MARDIESYLRELQAALASAGADPAFVQDALFDAEEYLRAEVATGNDFPAVAESYGTPEEVAAAYVGAAPAQTAAGAAPPEATDASPGWPTPPGHRHRRAPPAAPAWAPACPLGRLRSTGRRPTTGPLHPECRPAWPPLGLAAAAPNAWRQVFGVFVDPAAYKALVYMILSLATGITYFTLVVTGVSTAGGMLVLIVGHPALAPGARDGAGDGALRGTAGGRASGNTHAAPGAGGTSGHILERIIFWVKDGRTWASMAYMILMLPLGIAYFTIAVTGLSAGLG